MHRDPKTRQRPLLHKQPDHPVGGTPGRPWRRMLARALYEDQQRKKRPSQRSLIVHEGVLPKATKQDRGSLAGVKQRGPQRLCKRYIHAA